MNHNAPGGARTPIVNAGAQGTRVVLRDVRRVYDNGLLALDGVSLDVAPGEFVALLGPSGSGKSTLLRLVAGLDQPQYGSIDVAHTDIAYVFQDAHLLPWRNVRDNVALPLELKGIGRAARRRDAMAALELVGVPAEMYPAQLSGGMRMRASLARALVTRPKLLLLDEPFAALDEITRQRLDEHLLGLWEVSGVTVLFVTHSIAEAVFLAQRAVVLSRQPGRVILDRKIDLPLPRTREVRTTTAFAAEQRNLFEALKREEPS